MQPIMETISITPVLREVFLSKDLRLFNSLNHIETDGELPPATFYSSLTGVCPALGLRIIELFTLNFFFFYIKLILF